MFVEHIMNIEAQFDSATFTLTYILWDSQSKDAIVIDPVMDFDPAGGVYSFESVQKVKSFLDANHLQPHYILETHAHADHLSGAQELKRLYPHAKIGIGARITSVQNTFSKLLRFPADFPVDGSQFDCLFKDREVVTAGRIAFQTYFTPGHTPACASYLFQDAVFTGDALFMPDSGVGRCDFPDGDARVLHDSVTGVLFRLPGKTRVFVGHDYQPGGRKLLYQSTIEEEKSGNIHINDSISKEEFVKFRTTRDKTLGAPKLLYPSIQVNIAAGHLPPAEKDGARFIKIPVHPKSTH